MGPRQRQEKTPRNEETSKSATERLHTATTASSIRNETSPHNHGHYTQVKRHSAPTHQEQEPVPSTKSHTQKHQEPLPATVIPPLATPTQSQPVPPEIQPRTSVTRERHQDTKIASTEHPKRKVPTEEHPVHQSTEPIRQDVQHHGSGQESQPLNTKGTPGKLQRLVSNISNLGVNNISSYTPTADELVVLALGLNYIPESKDVSNIEILQAFEEFSSDLLEREKPKQHEFKFSNDPVELLKRKLRAKHKLRYGVDDTHMREPPIHTSYETKAYLTKCRESIKRITTSHSETVHRLSSDESKSINAVLWNLRTNELIIIKPADKNLGPTIMDRKWYISAGELILQDSSTYKAIPSFDVNTIRNELILILHKFGHLKFRHNNGDPRYGKWHNENMFTLLQKHITQQTPLAEILLEPFLNPDAFQACRGYFLPKLHKLDLPFPINPPLVPGRTPPVRPICASIGWVTYAVSVLLDIILKPIMLRLDSYIMNSASVAKHLHTMEFPNECALLSADVDSLYPSIDITRGLDAINQALLEYGTPPKDREFTIFLLRWVLFNNVLEFNNKLYLQIRGTAMGTPCAVVFACIFMGMLERRALASIRGISFMPLYYKRFIDDILTIAASIQDCEAIKHALNAIDPLIRVSGQTSPTSTNFLDLTIYKEDDFTQTHKLDLDLYQKPSNKFLFLPPTSEHAPHVPQGWITGYIRRIRTNCTRDTKYTIRRTEFWKQLQARGFQHEKLQKYFQYNPNRTTILASTCFTPKSQGAPKTLPLLFKIRMSTRTTHVLRQLKNALSVYPDDHPNRTFNNPQLRSIFLNRQRPIICFRNSKTIGSRLISARVPPTRQTNPNTTAHLCNNQTLAEYAHHYYQNRINTRRLK
jgi:hypothetical protein